MSDDTKDKEETKESDKTAEMTRINRYLDCVDKIRDECVKDKRGTFAVCEKEAKNYCQRYLYKKGE